jgi:hypothetical protein
MTSDRRKPSAGDIASKRVSPEKPPAAKRSSTDPYGTDLALKVKRKGRGLLAVSYWDLWMILLADREFDADLDLAKLVFEAALQPGPHHDYLRQHYEQL